MSEDGEKEKVKKIAKLRAILETRVETMEAELDGLKALLSLIDETLLKDSFKRAEISKPVQTPPKPQQQTPPPSPPPTALQQKGVPLKTVTGDILAYFYVDKDSIQITLAEDKNFDVNIPPFTSFFVGRVLANMQEKDREDVGKGKMAPENVLSYNIKQDGNTLKEITIKNLRRERSRELKSSIRWTLEKMYEKMKQQN